MWKDVDAKRGDGWRVKWNMWTSTRKKYKPLKKKGIKDFCLLLL